ncbi:chitin synthase-domain-containing protein, partial [Mycotypha africana]|uniref:chitin synthase-domain-containing protein n=1 Tax=Mycotypha africana TaxID=64632 RepID=UPI00230025B3
MRVDNYSCSYNRHLSCRRLIWIAFSRCLTFFIPDFILCYVGGMKTSASRNAWREKIAILFLFLLSAGFFCVWLEFISSYFCDPDKTYEYNEVFANDSKMAAIHGKAVDWRSVDSSSPSFATKNAMVQWVNQYPHHDLSNNFPTFMVLNRPSNKAFYADSIVNDCVFGQNKAEEADAWLDFVLESNPGYTYETISNVKQLLQCPMPNQPNVTGSPCFYGPEVEAELSMLPVKGDVEYDPNVIYKLYNGLPSSDNSTKQAYVILDGYVLDVTTYLTGATNIIPLSSTLSSRSFALDRMFLPLDLTMFLYINLGKDISEYFEGNVTENAALYRNCLIHLFRKGVVPSYISSDCRRINPALWATMGVGLIYFLIKMNLAQLFRATFIQKRCLLPSLSIASSMAHINTFSHVNSMQEQHQQPWPYVVLMIPCFSESAETLKQTIDSVSRTTYDDRSKILVFICDGVTISAQERIETHILLLQYLGYSRTEKPWPQPYSSLGQHQKRFNCACVYSGFFETGRNRVPYLVIVKVGQEQEQEKYSQKGQQQQQQQQQEKEKLAPPGNRGKRDSLLILFSFLERCSNLADNLMTPLDYEIFNQCYNVLGIDPRLFKYVMVTDADIQIQNDVVQRLVLRLEQDPNMLAISGHVRPANPEENLTTMLQIFPIYMTYFSAFAFEACLKSVMTINGGLVMYRVWKETDRRFTLQQQQPKHDTPFWKNTGGHPRSTVQDQRNPFADTAAAAAAASVHHGMRPESRFIFGKTLNRQLCCVHPTVIRGFSTPQANTMHRANVLLLGEDKILPLLLLKSHPRHHLGFEPEAVGYTTLPTRFFSLQGHQVRHLRATFHAQLEFQRAAWHLGFTYWLLSTTEVLDRVFFTPIIVYLYGVFGRALGQYGMAYVIIACSFTGLVVLHFLFFMLRRQFRYICWFILYCLLSLPLYAVWFPLLAVWQSNQAEYWYDVWPRSHGQRTRWHGIIDPAVHN